MSHDRDHDHRPAGIPPKPEDKRREHPTPVPREPVDPRPHPSRRPEPVHSRPA
jgi:hypothetical protein